MLSMHSNDEFKLKTDLSLYVNKKIGYSAICNTMPENLFKYLRKIDKDILLLLNKKYVKIYHYSDNLDKVLSEGFKSKPPWEWEEYDSDFAQGSQLYFYDFYLEKDNSHLDDSNLLIGEYKGDWFKCICCLDEWEENQKSYSYIGDEYFSFNAYDFAKIKWRKPKPEDLYNPKFDKPGFTKPAVCKYFQALENLKACCFNVPEEIIKYPFDSTDIKNKIDLALKWLNSQKRNAFF